MSEGLNDNHLPSNAEIKQLAAVVLNELEHFGTQPPFVGYVKVQEGTKDHLLFICRHQRPNRSRPSSEQVDYVSYKAQLGRLAAANAGETAIIKVPEVIGLRPTGHFWSTEYSVREKDLFEAHQHDALKNDVQFVTGKLFILSLRGFLEAEVEAAKPARRRVADKFELQDLAIVDKYQDDIFRIPISTFLLIYGAPGTGKTTTVIKRLAQKTNPEFLSENGEIQASEVENLRTSFDGPTNWVLFIPSELLRGYLKEALAQEGLPATEDNVLVWREYRVTMARDALKVLKTGSRGTFMLQDGLVASPDSNRLASWTLMFEKYCCRQVASEFSREVAKQQRELKSICENALAEIRAAEEAVKPMQQQAAELRSRETAAASEKEKDSLHQELVAVELRIDSILDRFAEIRLLTECWNRLVEEGNVAASASPQYHVSRLARRIGEIAEFYKMQANRLREQRQSAGSAIQDVRDRGEKLIRPTLEKLLRDYSLDSILPKLGPIYQDFRISQLSAGTLHSQAASASVQDHKIDPVELDTLIYIGLNVVRESLQGTPMPQRSGGSVSQLLINEMRMVVTVDEASDFSATELACMKLLAHPRFNSIALSGDLMQRMTREGIHRWEELDAFGGAPQRYELKISYRQSPRLLKIAAALYRHALNEPAPFESAFRESSDDPEALKFQATDNLAAARWIADRIVEVYRSNEERLPSIAILVPSEKDVQPTHLLIDPILLEHSIKSEACFEGRVLGTKAKVRIFNVEFIKGLEFEAVFFLGIDQIALASPELVARYLYVGLTRARNFLAVTYGEAFPAGLNFIEEQFAKSTWAGLSSDRIRK